MARAGSVDSPAVILYTSGSTGRPKGICNDQRAISQRVIQFTNTCGLNGNDRFILLSSPGTIAGIRDTFAALLNGATLHIADPQRAGIGGILRIVRAHRITIIYAVPALLRELLQQPAAKEALKDLRILRIGGDAIRPTDIELCRAVLPSACRILIGYGSTEVPTVFQWFVPPDWAPDGPRVPCGHMSHDATISLLAEDGTQAMHGEIAELIIKSRYIAIGTWQDGHLHSDAFSRDPGNASERVIHTGDLVRVRGDGLVELIGRKDRQLKIRGFRIDPGDIEFALRGCDEVTDAAVISKTAEGTDVLIAYVVPRTQKSSFIQDRVQSTLQTLPLHMRPARIHYIDAIPRLPSFKPDTKKLQSLDSVITETTTKEPSLRDTPVTEIEAKMLAIWRRLLKSRDLGVADDFFSAGGNSLLAMKLTLEIESQLRFDVSLERLFANATVRKLCATLDTSHDRNPASILPIRTADSQNTLYFIHSGFEFSAVSDALTSDITTAFVTTGNIKWLRSLVDTNDILTVVDRISEAYAQAIFAKGKLGPSYLAGHSFGGILALETACKLEALGKAPHTVFLFDTYVHNSFHRISYDILHNRWLLHKLRQIFRGDGREILRRMRFLARTTLLRLTQSAVFEKSRVVATEDTPDDENLRLIFRNLREEASQAYNGPKQALSSQIVLFRASKAVGGWPMKIDPDLGWAALLSQTLSIVLTPGDHYSLLEDGQADYLVREIDRRIALRGPNEGMDFDSFRLSACRDNSV